MKRPRLIIAPGKEKALLRRHPWIFSGAVRRIEGTPQEGDVVDVADSDGHWLATGHYQPDSIVCKVLSFDTPDIDDAFFRQRLRSAIEYRRRMGFLFGHGMAATDVFRLVHAEGDMMPGLVADWYNGIVVLQAHSVGMHRLFPLFVVLLRELLGDALVAVFDKSSATLPSRRDSTPSTADAAQDGYLWYADSRPEDDWEVTEHGNRLLIDFYEGQKTGFFIDQRDNRALVQQLAAGHRVLNCFGYTGGFSLAALRGGAAFVETVDISRKAIALCNRNVALNFGDAAPHRGTVADVLDFLAHPDGMRRHPAPQGPAAAASLSDGGTLGGRADGVPPFDFIVLDPPAFAKNHRVLQAALKGYRSINQRAMEALPDGGLLMTFSCSQAVSVDDFRTMVFTAAANAKRQVRIVRNLPHAADHPVSVYHPEGEYLKGMLLEVGY